MKKIIVIVGATGTYKTTLAIKIANDVNGEIINCDAFQVYKELNVGVNKPDLTKNHNIKFHLINEFSIYDNFNISVFKNKVDAIIDDIIKRKKIPILCGGSNLYIDSVIKNFELNKYPDRNEIDFFNDWEYQKIYDYAFEHNQAKTQKIGFNNQKRIIRLAQQIYWDQKNPNQSNSTKSLKYDYLIIETILDRNYLYEKINKRVDEMIDNNWYDEVLNLYNKDHNIVNLNSLCAIGYKQILESILNNNEINIEKIKQLTRNYAKKQITWNKHQYNNIYQFNYLKDNYNKLIQFIRTFFNWIQ